MKNPLWTFLTSFLFYVWDFSWQVLIKLVYCLICQGGSNGVNSPTITCMFPKRGNPPYQLLYPHFHALSEKTSVLFELPNPTSDPVLLLSNPLGWSLLRVVHEGKGMSKSCPNVGWSEKNFQKIFWRCLFQNSQNFFSVSVFTWSCPKNFKKFCLGTYVIQKKFQKKILEYVFTWSYAKWHPGLRLSLKPNLISSWTLTK